jgi:hypothetical protein
VSKRTEFDEDFDEGRIESIARCFCEYQGLDPDQIIGHGIEGSGMWHQSPRWRLEAHKVREHLMLVSAVAEFPLK